MKSNQSGVYYSFQKNIRKNSGLDTKKEVHLQEQLDKKGISSPSTF